MLPGAGCALGKRSPLHTPAAQSSQELGLTGTAQTLDMERNKRIVCFFKASVSASSSSSHTAHRSPATPNPIPCSQRTETNVQTAIFTHSDTRIQIFGHPANAAPACPVQLSGCHPQRTFWRYKGKTPTAGRFAGEARV